MTTQRKAILLARIAFGCPILASVIYLICQVFIRPSAEGQHIGFISIGDPVNLMLAGWGGSMIGMIFARESYWINNDAWSIGNMAFYWNGLMFLVFWAIAYFLKYGLGA